MSAHHSKIEHFVIHVVATLFLFFSIFSTFLGYGIYQTNQQEFKPQAPLQPKAAKAAGGLWFNQGDWNSTSSQTYAVNWSSDAWDKYSSATNVTTGNNLTANAPGAELISSIFDVGTAYRTSGPSYNYNGSQPTLYIRGANTEAGVSSAAWKASGLCNAANRYIQYKVVFSQAGDDIDDIFFSAHSVQIFGIVKDTSTGSAISGATVSYDGQTTTTALNDTSIIPAANAAGPGWQPGSGGYVLDWFYKASNSNTISVSAGKTGYNTQTKSVTINPSSCDFTKTGVDFSLTKPSNSSSKSTTSTVVPTTTTDSITKVKLPSAFTQEGSKTTDLSKIKDLKKVKDLVLDVVGKGTLKFNETVNLSANKTIAAFEKLGDYLKVGTGYVDLNSKVLSALNKKATVTMYKLKHLTTPEILADGAKDNSGVVSNISYDPKSGRLTFDVAHFTRFEAAVKFEVLSPTSTQITEPNTSIKVRVSDPETTITGSFNGIALGKVTPDKKTGEFTLEKLVFDEGENILKLGGESKLGKVAPLAITFTYGQRGAVDTSNKSQSFTALVVVLLSTLVAASILGYLIYRRKKLRAQVGSKEEKEPNETTTKDSK